MPNTNTVNTPNTKKGDSVTEWASGGWLYFSSDGVDTVIPLKVMIGFHFRTLQNWLYESNQQQISNNLPRHHFPISKTLASHTVRPWLVWINDLPMQNDDLMIPAYCCKSKKSGDEGWLKWVENILPGFHYKSHKIYSFIHTYMGPGKHKMLSKLATQSFNILWLIARNPNFLQPKVPYFNVSRRFATFPDQ